MFYHLLEVRSRPSSFLNAVSFYRLHLRGQRLGLDASAGQNIYVRTYTYVYIYVTYNACTYVYRHAYVCMCIRTCIYVRT